jgi:hypothetical protein
MMQKAELLRPQLIVNAAAACSDTDFPHEPLYVQLPPRQRALFLWDDLINRSLPLVTTVTALEKLLCARYYSRLQFMTIR